MNWRKSNYSGQSGGNCVEIGNSNTRVLVRDTQDKRGPALRFTPDAWRRFADQIKRSLSPDPRMWGRAYAVGGRSVSGRPLRHAWQVPRNRQWTAPEWPQTPRQIFRL